MTESIEEKLLREELDLYNNYIDQINELIPKIVIQFETKLPAGHIIVKVWGTERDLTKVAWPLTNNPVNFCITTEGYFLIQLAISKRQFMIRKFNKISSVGDVIFDEDSDTSVTLNSKYLKYYLSLLNKFYLNNQKMIDTMQK